jgi:catechol 2,3-dioxygenase-like lactoylglutathione lyase family enzyme
MRVQGLNHVSVRIEDLSRSRAFYEGLLGLALAPRPDLGFPGAWYEVGGSQLHLIQSAKMMDGIDPTDPHFAVEVPRLDDVKRLLEARAIPYLAFGPAQLWVRDPDGNVVEICERR